MERDVLRSRTADGSAVSTRAARPLHDRRAAQAGASVALRLRHRPRAEAVGLVPDDLDDPAAVALAVELEEEHALPRPEAQLAVAHGDRLAGRAEQHRHAM